MSGHPEGGYNSYGGYHDERCVVVRAIERSFRRRPRLDLRDSLRLIEQDLRALASPPMTDAADLVRQILDGTA
jgi:hypothetical protein